MVGTAPFPCRTTDYLFLTQCEGWISQNTVSFNNVWLTILYHFFKTGIHRVRALCRILRLTFLMEETAETHFKQAYEHPNFIRVSLQKKEVLAGCCVLATCRQHSWPIAMGTICCLLEANPRLIGVVYQEMVKTLKIEAPPTSIIDLLETHCQA